MGGQEEVIWEDQWWTDPPQQDLMPGSAGGGLKVWSVTDHPVCFKTDGFLKHGFHQQGQNT